MSHKRVICGTNLKLIKSSDDSELSRQVTISDYGKFKVTWSKIKKIIERIFGHIALQSSLFLKVGVK